MFTLDHAFEASSIPLAALSLCEARLHLDARFAWLVLVPRVPRARELEDLAPSDRGRLMEEIVLAGRAARAVGRALDRPIDKLNVGALGNVTAQLHLHVVGRRVGDAGWPGPVWGLPGSAPYDPGALSAAVEAARAALAPAG